MPENLPITIPTDEDSFLRATAEEIERAFGMRFDLWINADPWCRFLPEQTSSDVTASPDLLVHLERSAQSNAMPFVEPVDGSWLLVVPLRPARRVTATATATFDLPSPDQLVLAARLFVERLQLEQELRQEREETLACAGVITQTFEEVTLLRRMAKHLALTDLSLSPLALAEAVLPELKNTIGTESVLLVDANTDRLEPGSVGKVSFCAGPQPSDWRGIVERFGETSAHVVVKNYLRGDSTEQRPFPGVGEFILAPLAASEGPLGWILAINRQKSRGTEHQDQWVGPGESEFGTVEADLVATTASILAVHVRNVMLLDEKEQVFLSAVRSLVCAVDAKDPYTCGHSERVGMFAQQLGQEFGLDTKACSELYLSGLLHDVGKIGIPGSTLRKPGNLTEAEFAHIKSHPERGWEILRSLERLGQVLPAVVHHHEQFDGSGYPDGLRGDEIPLAGRILAVADAYDAMSSDRPYRKGLPHEKVLSILRTGSGTQWDPDLVEAFFRSMPAIIEIGQSYQPRQRPCRKPDAGAVPPAQAAPTLTEMPTANGP